MKEVLLILPIVIVITIYILYSIGKKVKEKEALMKDWMDEQRIKTKLDAMKKKERVSRTPKVPRVKPDPDVLDFNELFSKGKSKLK